MRAMVLVGSFVLVGCVPHSTSKTIAVSRHVGTTVTTTRAPVVTAELAGGVAGVVAVIPARCITPVIDEVEVHDATEIELIGTSNGSKWGYGALAGMILAWPVGLAALGVSGVAVLAKPPKHETRRRFELVARLARRCDRPAANLPVRVTFASGASIDGATGDDGRWMVVVPNGETGPVTARAIGVQVTEEPELAPLRTAPATDSAITVLARTAAARVRSGDCATARRIGESVKVRDPAAYANVFVPLLADCP